MLTSLGKEDFSGMDCPSGFPKGKSGLLRGPTSKKREGLVTEDARRFANFEGRDEQRANIPFGGKGKGGVKGKSLCSERGGGKRVLGAGRALFYLLRGGGGGKRGGFSKKSF